MGKSRDGDLSVTALYTSQVWAWAGFQGANLLTTNESKWVFRVTNAALGLGRLFKRGPSLRHGLAQRHAMLDRLAAGSSQVIELAAGLSCRGVAFSSNRSVRYVEVDLPDMLDMKRELLERTEEGSAVLDRDNLRFVGADVLELDFGKLGLEPGPVTILTEGLFMYTTADEQRSVWRRLAAFMADRPDSRFCFDLVPGPEHDDPGLFGAALDWGMRRFTDGSGFIDDRRTREEIISDLQACGFDRVEVLEPRDHDLDFEGIDTLIRVFSCSITPHS